MHADPDPCTSEGTRRGEPEARYAVFGAVFGLLLIWLGWRSPFRVAAWLLIGVGGLFVAVMSAYLTTLVWKNVAPRLVFLLKILRGHVRRDPHLGRLVREPKVHSWEGTLRLGDRTVIVEIGGDAEPSPILLASARVVAADLAAFDQRLQQHVAQQAREEAADDAELADELAAQRMSSIRWSSAKDPGRAVIDFHGPDEGRFWYCDYVDGQIGPLDFDS